LQAQKEPENIEEETLQQLIEKEPESILEES
jgi:hypothetical protein